MKIFVYSDNPTTETGNGRVMREILKELVKHAEVEVLGINFTDSWYDQNIYPYKIHFVNPILSGTDILGTRQLQTMLRSMDFDIFLTLGDVHILDASLGVIEEERKKKKFKWVAITMTDYDFTVKSPIKMLTAADHIIVPGQFSKDVFISMDESLKDKITVVYYGINFDNFKQLSGEQRRKTRKDSFGIDDDTVMFLNVARNQWRKDLARSIEVFHEYHKENPNSIYYIHSKVSDEGGHLPTIAKYMRMSEGIVFTAPNFDITMGYSDEVLNKIYNAADVSLSTNLGEGFGLFTWESFASKLPVVAPNHSMNRELVGDDRGYLIDLEDDLFVPYGVSDYSRHRVKIKDAVDKIRLAVSDKECKNRAYRFVKQFTWEKQAKLYCNAILNSPAII